jgi:NAD(P)-dependent dehydrogenase (short-subunit alcohol dehydrogenase family)
VESVPLQRRCAADVAALRKFHSKLADSQNRLKSAGRTRLPGLSAERAPSIDVRAQVTPAQLLASPASSYVTGQELVVDGGLAVT